MAGQICPVGYSLSTPELNAGAIGVEKWSWKHYLHALVPFLFPIYQQFNEILPYS